jgi:LysM repeat protein
MRGNPRVARWLAPAAFLVAATIAVLLVRSGLSRDEEAPTPTAAATTAPTGTTRPATTTRAATTAQTPAAEFYVIEAGDTLAVIADRYDTTVEELLVLNPDIDPVSLTIGQRIRVK